MIPKGMPRIPISNKQLLCPTSARQRILIFVVNGVGSKDSFVETLPKRESITKAFKEARIANIFAFQSGDCSSPLWAYWMDSRQSLKCWLPKFRRHIEIEGYLCVSVCAMAPH